MIYLLAFILLATTTGAAALSFLDKEKKIGVWGAWVYSIVLGTTLQGFVALILALATKNLTNAGWLTLVAASAVSVAFWKKIKGYVGRTLPPPKLSDIPHYLLLALMGGIVLLLAYQSMIWVDGFPYGILKGWGDGAYHMDMIQVLAQSNPFHLQHSVAGGTPLTYTFFINFLSALLLKLGASFPLAWHLPLFIYGLGIVAGLWGIGKLFIQKHFLVLACMAIVLFGGGLGFFIAQFSDTPAAHNTLWENIIHPPYQYTHMDIRTGGKSAQMNYDENIVWITPVISFFSHQRSFMPAAALAFLFLVGIYTYWKTDTRWRWFMLPGLIPLSHLHTTLAIGIFALVILAFHRKEILRKTKKNKKYLLRVFLPVGIGLVIAAPQLLYLFSNANAASSLALWFGWMTCTHATNWFSCDQNTPGTDTSVFWFLFKNFGIVFIAWILSLAYIRKIKKNTALSTLWISGTIIGVLGILVKFQPWEFDNNKLLFYWWFAVILVSIVLLEAGYKALQKKHPLVRYGFHATGALLIITSLLSGAIDVGARARIGTSPDINRTHFGYYGNEVQSSIAFIKKNTPPKSIIVAATGASNFIPMTTGRALYLGFDGWLWTQGRWPTAQERKKDIQAFLATSQTKALCSKGATHAYVDAAFRNEFAPYIQNNSFSQTKKIHQDGFGVLYELQCD